MLLKLAWLNLWRNKRRTFITMASVSMAVVLSTILMSIKEGTYDRMTDAVVGAFTGYLQIHKMGYWDEQTLENSFPFHDSLIYDIEGVEGVKDYLPRVESFALTSHKEYTRGALIIGTVPEKEFEDNSPQKNLVAGQLITSDDQAVMLGNGLAKYLKLDVGDTLVILGQGYHAVSAVGKYPVKGIIRYGSPELSKRLVFLPLKEAQWLFGAENRLTSLVIKLNDNNTFKADQKKLGIFLGNGFEIMSWDEMLPELKQMFEADRVEGYVFMAILYLVISFGIFGTVVMILAERQHEFGVVVALGMFRFSLGFTVFLEIVIISLLGALTGMILAFPICLWLHLDPVKFGSELAKMYEDYGFEPVVQASIAPYVFIQQAVVVTLLAILIAVYPLIRVSGMKAINAMRS